MKVFGNNTKNKEGLPVATLVSEESAPLYQRLASAPVEPTVTPIATVGAAPSCCQTKPKVNAFGSSDPTISRFPMMMRECPGCHQESRTRVTTAPTWKTWTAAGVMTCVFWPLCWIPLVTDSCKQTDHFCASCGTKVASVDAFQDCCVEHRG